VAEDAAGTVCGYVYASKHKERAAYQWSVDTTVYVRDDMRGQVGRALYDRLLPLLAELGYCQAFAGGRTAECWRRGAS
jgi:phosphinothricin acetyltransferase